MDSLRLIDEWPVQNAAAAVVRDDGAVLGWHGDRQRTFPLASVTKMLTAYVVLIAVEEGAVELDAPAGPDGATIRHLLAHSSGLAFDEELILARPGTRRIYSSAGFDVLAATVEAHTGIPFTDYATDAVLRPLGMTSTTCAGSPASGASATLDDMVAFVAELQSPTLLDRSTVAAATAVAGPGLDGVLPGYGRQSPNDWGLGFEIRNGKSPHWTGASNSPETFGHFGQAGTFVWVDPQLAAACVVLSDRNFGSWSVQEWPPFSDAVVGEVRRQFIDTSQLVE